MTITIPAKLLIKTRADASVIVELFLDISIPQGGSQSLYAFLDSQSGECTAMTSSKDSAGALTGSNIQKSEIGGGGAISSVSLSSYAGNESYNVAYGDDFAGSIAYISSWTDTYATSPVTHDCYWGEYYNSTGDLIRRDNGDTSLWVPDWGLDRQKNLVDLGITTAPSLVEVRYTGSAYEYRADSGPWTVLPGYTVPAAVAFGGKSYYMSYECPLKNLLPLSPAYSADYALIQREGETFNYDYYLNKAGSPVGGYEPDQGDIWLNDKLCQYDMYYWSVNAMSKARGYFFRASDSQIPPYFSAPDLSCVSAVQANLMSVLSGAQSLSAEAYNGKLYTLAGDNRDIPLV